MSTDTPNHGFFVRIGLHGHLCREHAADPLAAVRSLLHKGSSLHDKDRAWVWHASPLRPDLYDPARPARAGAFGPVGDPIVFEVGLELLELAPPSDDPEVLLDEMLSESEKTDAPPFPTAPDIASCRYHSDQDVFFVNFKGNLPEVFPGARVKRRDGTPVAPGLVRGCEVDQFRRNVLVELADGAQTSFSAIDVLYKVNPEFRAQWDAASKARGDAEGQTVHILVDGASVCGYEAVRVPARDAGCTLDTADRLATCPECLAGRETLLVRDADTEVTLSAQPDTSEEEKHMGRGSRIEREIRRTLDISDQEVLILARDTVDAIWEAVDDLDAVPPGTSPAHVVEKHLRNGNIQKDGEW